ncbi:MAG: tetratricopeptide repeat protein [Gammaproteobacteria bacterium]|nr:tetratricopeptide repeat protein [Gammaproteobacteria bacterium]
MNSRFLIIIALSIINTSCFNAPKVATIESLSDKQLELEEVTPRPISRDNVIGSYEQFLNIAKPGALHGDALRRLADLKLESSEENNISVNDQLILKSQDELNSAISLYKSYIRNYPNSPGNELILYQLSKAYSLSGQTDNALDTMNQLVKRYPSSRYMDEVQFRIAEIYFSSNDYVLSARAYKVIVDNHSKSIFYEKALYKYAWSLFKQNEYTHAVDNFLILLKQINLSKYIETDSLSGNLPRTDKELILDTLRVISIAISYQDGHQSLASYISRHDLKDYEALLFRQLGDLYINKERVLDAANTYLAFTKRNPDNAISPGFHTSAIHAYVKGGFPSLVLKAKESFVNQYAIDGDFWIKQSQQSKSYLRPLLSKHILDLAQHHHATAKKSRSTIDYKIAAAWYRTYLKDFSADNNASHINFLLAEALFDSHDYVNAIKEYETTSYNYKKHKHSAEAGYAALLSYKKLLKNIIDQKQRWKIASLNSALIFSSTYPADKRTPAVLGKTAEDFFKLSDYKKSAAVALKLINEKPDNTLSITGYTVLAHSQFELKNYQSAELSYKKLLNLLGPKSKSYNEISNKLAACIYKQGEELKSSGKLMLAAQQFIRLGKTVPSSSLRSTAEYDAATIYIQQKQWAKSIKILEKFRKQYPKQLKLQQGVTEKLALAYTETDNHPKAAKELLTLSANSKDAGYINDLKLQAAEHYQKSNNADKAIKIYMSVTKTNTLDFPKKIELQNIIAGHYKSLKHSKQWHYWLSEIIKTNKKAGARQTDYTNLLAANAELVLLKPKFNSYKRVKLKIPLKKSLKKKKALMADVIKSYENIIQYQLAETTTAATYGIGESYKHFAYALMDSQRPKGLSADELEQYEILLEEQAYPFEEKAIAIHEVNIKQTQNGIYNEWVKNSLKTLGEILPVRYAKKERIDNHVDVIY